MPDSPSNFSILGIKSNTTYTTNKLMKIATKIFSILYSERSDNNVVNVPAPAINGNAIGTTDEACAGPPDLKISLFKIISNPIKKITIAPAMENDSRFTPNN